ncbi:MAG: DUF3793 family protein, partial [Aeriscardovia sp.]|nr:DUF3793 family protein [Aeriscardovia sp.]
SLFSYPASSLQDAAKELGEYAQVFQEAGLCALPLTYLKNGRALVYVYRPQMLERDLAGELQAEILKSCGYGSLERENCIRTLIRHLQEGDGFPHEIGLFLGYPPEDVKGFIENRGEHAKYTGTWKVYGNLEESLAQFARFQRCTRAYVEAGRRGVGLRRLAVRRTGNRQKA